MNRKSISSNRILGVAVAAALLSPLSVTNSYATVEVYGRAHVSVDMLDNGDESGLNVSSNSSRVGFRASTEIMEGVKGKVQIEQEVRFDHGPNASGGTFATRDSFAGLEGGFGGIRLGQFDTPLKKVRGAVDFFGDQVGDTRNLARLNRVGGGYSGDFDTRFQNGVHYYSPDISGFVFDLHYSTNTNELPVPATVTDPNDEMTAYSVALTYKKDALYAALAMEQQEARADSNAVRLAASYKVGDATIAGMYQMATLKVDGLDDLDIDVYGIGASYKVSGNTTVKGQYYILADDRDDRDASMLALGVDYSLSKQFRLLFVYAMTDNDDLAAFRVSDSGHGDATATVTGETASGFSAGFRYDF